ncbi:MAG: VIT1/CCC1 transporter family protein [Chloroflexota bacterium]
MTNLIDRFRKFDRLVKFSEIARRYFAMNAFDGVLTIIGVLMGNMTAGVDNPRVVVITGMSTCVAMGVSGLWGAYLTESAERERELDELSRQTLTDMDDTRVGRASKTAVVAVAVVDGLSPFLGAVIVLIPFFFVSLLPSITWAYYSSIAMALLALFGLGIFLGMISRGRLIVSGIRTVTAGVVSILISYLMGVEG